MFVHLAFHYPKKEHEQDVIDSMHRFSVAMQGAPGLIFVKVLKDRNENRLSGLALWESKEHWDAAMPALRPVVENDPFDLWEEKPIEVFHLDTIPKGFE